MEKYKNLLKIAALVVFIVIMGFFLNNKKSFSEHQLTKLTEAQILETANSIEAEKQRKEIILQNRAIHSRLQNINRELFQMKGEVNILHETYKNNLQNLNNLKNEKEYIPTATANEQYDFLSKYKYSEY